MLKKHHCCVMWSGKVIVLVFDFLSSQNETKVKTKTYRKITGFFPLSSADLTINKWRLWFTSHGHCPHAYIKPSSSRRCCLGSISLKNSNIKPDEMIHVSRTPEFSNCGTLNCTSPDQSIASVTGGRSRQRSHSYYSPEECKNYGAQVQTVKTNLRPRSRYVHTVNCEFMTSDLCFSSPSHFVHAYPHVWCVIVE